MTDVKEVAEICARFQGACRAMHLYPPGHSMIESRMQPLASALTIFLSRHDSLPLQVEESTLLYRGEEVFRQEELRDDIAFMLFREGVRVLTLHAGLEQEELNTLVDCFSRAPEATALGQDLVTLLWEEDFSHVEYKLVDPLRLEMSDAGRFEALKADVRARLHDSGDADLSLTTPGWYGRPAAGGPPTSPTPLDIESGVLVGPEELSALEEAIKQEPRPLELLVGVLIEMLVCAGTDRGTEAARSALSRLTASELQRGDLALLQPTVARLHDVRRRRPDRAAAIDAILADLAHIDPLRRIVLGLDGAARERQEEVEAFLPQLAPHSYPALLDLLAEAKGGRARKCLLNTLTTDRRLPAGLLEQRLSDPRWFVVRNMVVLLRTTGERCPPQLLLPGLHHTDERVRREVVRTLSGAADPQADVMLRSALSDSSPAVRNAAARAVGRRGGPDALPALLDRVRSPGFMGRDPGEVIVFLEALAGVADDRAVPTLVSLSRDRFLHPLPLKVRQAALRGLVAVGTPACVAGLQKARRSRNRSVREEAERWLLAIGSGRETQPARED